ncbi:MAG: hypothetical protein ACLU38_07000 [Dysosmobacter sp.]
MADRAANTGIFLALRICSYLVFCVIGMFFSRTFFVAPGRGSNRRSWTTACITPRSAWACSIGIFSQFCFERLLQIHRPHQSWPCVPSLLGALINIVLDPILIFGLFGAPRMGVAGAAVATVAGQIVAASWRLIMNLKCNPDIHILPRKIRWDATVAKEIYRVGFPSIVMQSIGSVDGASA